MNLEQQVAHLKSCITDLIGGYRQSNVSLEDWFNALWNAEQALNVHDCQDPEVGCSCSGSVRHPASTGGECSEIDLMRIKVRQAEYKAREADEAQRIAADAMPGVRVCVGHAPTQVRYLVEAYAELTAQLRVIAEAVTTIRHSGNGAQWFIDCALCGSADLVDAEEIGGMLQVHRRAADHLRSHCGQAVEQPEIETRQAEEVSF